MADDPKNCLELAIQKAAGRLTDREVMKAFEQEQKIRAKLMRYGKTDNLDQRVADEIVKQAQEVQIAAALKKKQAALNIRARIKLDDHIADLRAQGLKPNEAVRALMEGVQVGVRKGRVSVFNRVQAYKTKFLDALHADIVSEKPHLFDSMRSKAFDDNLTRELYELREGGTPGKTGDKDAQWLAAKMAAAMEVSRTELNRLGASIGKLDGYAGPQVHDDLELARVGKEKWVKDILPMLDFERTFADVPDGDVKTAEKILGDIYDTIRTGISAKPGARGRGQYAGPSNLANSLGKHRVLHFRDAEAALQYRDQYGRGSTAQGIYSQLERSAQKAGAMDMFGPNPEYMAGAVLDKLQRDLKESGAPVSEIDKLDFDKFETSINQMTGFQSVPVNVNMAQINGSIRSGLSMAKLGGAVITATPTDFATVAQSGFFRGQGFWNTALRFIGEMANSKDPEAKKVAALIGEGFDGVTGHIMNAAVGNDTLPGTVSKWAERYYRWNFLTKWTDAARAAAGRVVAAHLGDNVSKAFDALHFRTQHVLELNGIGPAEWDAIRAGAYTEINGRKYVTPDRMRYVDEAIIRKYAADELAGVKEEKHAGIIAQKRRELELLVGSYINDETSYGVLETDAASRRVSSWGSRPGTPAGEAIRYVMQFKGFPIAFSQRVLGRAVYGAPGATTLERAINNRWHIGTVLAGLTAAGYMSMTIKDMVAGHWPPRNPFDQKTLQAALLQGGTMGIYGDFLFAQASRYGNSPLVTSMGPGAGTVDDFLKIYYSARDGNTKAGAVLNFVYNNIPYANLFYVRPVTDFLFMNSLREWANPGYLARKEQKRREDYGQGPLFPQTVGQALGR